MYVMRDAQAIAHRSMTDAQLASLSSGRELDDLPALSKLLLHDVTWYGIFLWPV